MANPFPTTSAPKAPKPTNPALAATVVRILRQPGLTNMNFELGGLRVSGPQFARVADAIEAGRIKCWTVTEFESQGVNGLAPGMVVNARYGIDSNAMLFSSEDFGTNPGEDRTIVHEAVHAAFDLDAPVGKKTQTLSIDDEAAAVVAVAFYIRLCNKPVGGFLMDADGPEKPALDLVDRIADRRGPVPVWRGPYRFSLEDTRPIRDGAARKWNFNKFRDTDGSQVDNSGARYVYDGVPLCSKKGCK